jgi:hypothetical protein
VAVITRGVTGKIEYIDWDDLRAEIAEQVHPERLEAAREELQAWLCTLDRVVDRVVGVELL